MSLSSDEEDNTHATDTPNGQNGGGRGKERWEDIQRSWDLVTESADGSLTGTVEGLLEAGKRKRILRDTTPLQRGIIRHLALILDFSVAMSEKDLRPSRYLLMLRYVTQFITAFFEQNPISQLCLISMRDGLARTISPMSGNPTAHISALNALRSQDPKGNPSLQNSLDMARGALFHSPSHGTREIVIIFGALYSADPGDIHRTIKQLVADSIRVNVVGLAARVAICQELCAKTNGVPKGDMSVYGVALNEPHFRELLMAYITPPATRGAAKTVRERETDRSDAQKAPGERANVPSLLEMGFPNLTKSEAPTLCACHGNATKTGYLCPRCKSKVCGLPSQCPGCGMQLIQSTHLARSYHHLFPLRNYVEVSWEEVRRGMRGGKGIKTVCGGCNVTVFPSPPAVDDPGEDVTDGVAAMVVDDPDHINGEIPRDPAPPLRRKSTTNAPAKTKPQKRINAGASESSRYRCVNCQHDFCIHCDVLFHGVVHNCPGCLGGL